jgi:uracil-DNA glycosylase family 4
VDDVRAHLEFFGELGIDGLRLDPQWRSRTDVVRPAAPAAADDPPTAASVVASPVQPVVAAPVESGPSPRLQDVVPDAGAVPAPVFASPAEALLAVRRDLGEDCSRCKLHTLGRRQIVFGVGNPNADLMFVGEAPGADEDIQGEPFVGKAGQLLTKIIEAIGLKRDDVYIANVIKCRPPGNRNPEPDEVAQCQPFLFRQVDIVKPKVIVALGKFAAQCLLNTEAPISRIRGREYPYRDAVLIPTYHPAFLLRNPSAKRDVWEDMKRVRALLGD